MQRKNQVLFLLNPGDQFFNDDQARLYLPDSLFDLTYTSEMPVKSSDYDLIVPWNYQRIIKNPNDYKNAIVIHSSDLPKGRGWAPLYNSIVNQQKDFVISCIRLSDPVDSGEIILKASFEMKSEYTATFLRAIDIELTFLIISKLFEKWPDGNFQSIKQKSESTYNKKRHLSDNEIKLNDNFGDVLDMLRAVESQHPAFIEYNGIDYIIEVRPRMKVQKPSLIRIEYLHSKTIENWSNWL